MQYSYKELHGLGKNSLLLAIGLCSMNVDAAQAPAGYIEVSRDPEVPLKHIYDGITVLREITRRRHWQHPTNPGAPFADTVRAERDNPIEGHEERQVVYAVPIRAQNALVQRDQRNQYTGNYDFRTNLGEDQKIAFGPLFYRHPTTRAIYHVKVTQQRWERADGAIVDFLVASYKADEKLRFIDDASTVGGLVLNDHLPGPGLYLLLSIDNEANSRRAPAQAPAANNLANNNNQPAANPALPPWTKRVEKWRCLERNAQNAHVPESVVEIRAPHGILSIPGIGAFARNEKVAPGEDDVSRLRVLKAQADRDVDALLLGARTQEGAVIITGLTGSGKTTFINCYANNPCVSREKANGTGWELYFPVPLANFAVGYGGDSKTTRPAFYDDHVNRLLLVDNPGDADTAGPLTDIINAAMTYRMFSNPGGVKLLVVFDEDAIRTGRNAEFINYLNDVVKSCPDDGMLHQMMHLMISKKRVLNIPRYLNSLIGDPAAQPQPIPQLAQLNDKPRVVSLIRFLLNHPERISTFAEAPIGNDGQQIPFAPDLTGPRASILTGPFIANPPVTIKIKESSHLLIEGLARRLNEEMVHHLRTDGAQKLLRYCRKKIDAHNGPVANLRTEFLNLATRLKGISRTATPDEFLQMFDGVPASVAGPGIPKLFNAVTMREIIANLTFLKAILPHNVIFNIREWKDALGSASPFLNTIGKIEILAKKPTVTVPDNNTICLKGLIVGSSDVEAEIAARNIAPTKIILHAYNTWFIDQDMTHNSACMYSIAPRWKVTAGNKVIDLSGLKGDNGAVGDAGTDGSAAAVATAGKDGKPGNPGKTAGSFFGKVYHAVNLGALTIKANGGQGGDGGKGGAGGKGHNAADGQVASLAEVPGSDSGDVQIIPWGDHHHQNTHGPWFEHRLYYNVSERYQYVGHLAPWIGNKFTDQISIWGHVKRFEHAPVGEAGKDGGKGGRKGVGGNAGDIIIRGTDACIRENNQGAEGANAGGAENGGQGGANGRVLKGTKWTNCRVVGESCPNPVDCWRPAAGTNLPDGSPAYSAPNPARAADGNKPRNADGTDKISDTAAPAATAKIVIDQAAEDSKVNDYRVEYRDHAKDEVKSIFVRVCPGLEQ